MHLGVLTVPLLYNICLYVLGLFVFSKDIWDLKDYFVFMSKKKPVFMSKNIFVFHGEGAGVGPLFI